MSTAGKVRAWVCIAGIFLSGCYTSTLIDPRELQLIDPGDAQVNDARGTEGPVAYPPDIEYVVMKGGAQYHFTTPPAVVGDVILINHKDGAIDILNTIDISYVVTREGSRKSLAKPAPQRRLPSRQIDYAIMNDGTIYMFKRPAAIYKNHIYGTLKAIAASEVADDPTAWKKARKDSMVALRVADVAQVSVSEYNPELTGGVARGLLAAVVAAFLVTGGMCVLLIFGH